ncbi:hypothetical protein MM221_15760 [Salipaludibacillus sp. LMS25]|jgi:hypothetical protein|uniref:hypothetical protein n=1 Tax=Salipaludibacillus sp. LMS25 TaxID=2924031 RepID=UPI0020D07FAE|nr:hypothetical protein [Salipaludibacillus sp. LMS25]UTR14050.1 hypothetical protein MM221_15760 [Salipaludibacillus sp. LMS25]
MDKEAHQVRKRARRFKKLFEKISVNALPWEIDGVHYFMVNYLKFNKLQGTAIFSPKKREEHPDSAREAHRPLFQFYRLMNEIHAIGNRKATIDATYFEQPLSLSNNRANPELQDGHAFLTLLFHKQTQFKDVYAHFFGELAKLRQDSQPLSQTHLDMAITTIAELDLYHYEIMKETVKHIHVLKNWISAMKHENLWEDLSQNHRVFFQQMVQNEEKVNEQLKSRSITNQPNRDKLLKFTKKKYTNFLNEERLKDFSRLRFPQ